MAGAIGCMANGCLKPKRNRGLCTTHYARLCIRVKSGETTWADLETAGECLPDATRAAAQKFYSDYGKSRRYKKE